MVALNSKIYTIGHSNRTAAFFIEMLRSFDVTLLADVRSMPGSKWVPQFNSKPLAAALQEHHIKYVHYPALGGRIHKTGMLAGSNGTAQPFSGYRSYIETDMFNDAIATLQAAARTENVAYMCAEANWWQCHRSIISGYLAGEGWEVLHITGPGKSAPHIEPGNNAPTQGILF